MWKNTKILRYFTNDAVKVQLVLTTIIVKAFIFLTMRSGQQIHEYRSRAW